MAKMWLIARQHFFEEVSKRSFLIVLFSLPLFLALTIGMGLLAETLTAESVTVGVVDPAGVLATITSPTASDVTLLPYDSREAARAALEAGDVDAFFIVAPGTVTATTTELVYYDYPGYAAVRHFENVVRYNLLAGHSPAVVNRLIEGATVTVRATALQREFVGSDPSASGALPLIAAVMFGFLAMTTSGYMMEVLVREKENRTMEVVVTSVSPGRLMLGKIIGAVAIAAVQLLVWVGFFAGAVWLGGQVLEIGWIRDLSPNWNDILQIVVVAMPLYLFITALMTTLGATLVDSEEAQQLGPMLFLVILLPIYFFPAVANDANGTLALILSFIPFTSLTTFGLRMLFAVVPWWQIVVAAVIALVGSAGAIWLAGRAFRVSMLRYGQRLRWRDLFRRERRPVAPPAPLRRVS